MSVSTANDGSYSLSLSIPGTYTVTPVSTNYLFMPSNTVVTVEPTQSNVNFKAYRRGALSLDGIGSGMAQLVFAGAASGPYRTLASSDLIHWSTGGNQRARLRRLRSMSLSRSTASNSNSTALSVPERTSATAVQVSFPEYSSIRRRPFSRRPGLVFQRPCQGRRPRPRRC